MPIDPNQTSFKFAIPEELASKNLVIEMQNNQNGLKSQKSYFSSTLKVRLFEDYGELKVFQDKIVEGKKKEEILPKSYIKVYQKKKNGTISFFKDGYTDLRGRFEYAILSGTSISEIEKFAIFV
mmetsp:Transcript_9905/g.9750  ORF Transcript_9905/g.9750 Transcript_9905/m.9750 type:complete len:124 (+) Transcript_9905:1441-1812(+)